MNDRSLSWVGTLSERVLDEKPIAFTPTEVRMQTDLFGHRAALFYTPTDSIPEEYIGAGPVEITLPIVTADYTESEELRYPKSPRFWVDLIQRQTMRIRWRPIERALVRITRYDYYKIRDDHFVSGIKPLLDAFKARTSGRTDGAWTYYFGAIDDDGPGMIELEYSQKCIDHPANARTRVQIEAI